ncbi:PREDICTED: uncharacterized protein LOC106292412 [Brassica oleracea var. oleracea]|uniref:uncharacterized protein LOC106292412 n=1 Tax=Brassica oleracea var. oleracea TaxID=109376 RepID=UPI0006A6BEEF|nr:PREDICTED: uncharacterized protein LOC106292412 [Brassica oleracea var. oleracea]
MGFHGFNVDKENFPGRVAYRELYPIDLDQPFKSGLTGRAYMQNNVDLTVDKFNKINGVVSYMCVYCEGCCLHSLLFSQILHHLHGHRDTPDGHLVEYQAKTEQMPCDSSADSNASSRGSDQAWDVDSFDDESEYQPPERMCPIEEEIKPMRLYRPKMNRSKGFYVDGETYPGETVFFSQVDLDERFPGIELTGREHMQSLVDLALEIYNNIEETNVTCESIVRANLTRVNGYKLYITFMAKTVSRGGACGVSSKNGEEGLATEISCHVLQANSKIQRLTLVSLSK